MTSEQAIDFVADFLALRDPLPPRADAAILLGNAVVACADVAARLLREEVVPYVVLSGGVGHSTPLLRQASGIDEANLSEAEIFAILLNQRGVDSSQLRLETRSTNTGGNAQESRRLLEPNLPASVILIQDPTMQRRSDATFRHVWRDAGTRFFNAPPCVPTHGPVPPYWEHDRFIGLLLGEIQRLRDDARGYGPNGKGFIVHVDIPTEVERAAAIAAAAYPEAANR